MLSLSSEAAKGHPSTDTPATARDSGRPSLVTRIQLEELPSITLNRVAKPFYTTSFLLLDMQLTPEVIQYLHGKWFSPSFLKVGLPTSML